MGPDVRNHCQHYVDRDDPEAAIRNEPSLRPRSNIIVVVTGHGSPKSCRV
jgi:hypothetical protein